MSALRPVTLSFKSEHAALLRKVAKWMSRYMLGRLYNERILVALLLTDMADKIDAAFAAPGKSNVIPLPVKPRGGSGPERAA